MQRHIITIIIITINLIPILTQSSPHTFIYIKILNTRSLWKRYIRFIKFRLINFIFFFISDLRVLFKSFGLKRHISIKIYLSFFFYSIINNFILIFLKFLTLVYFFYFFLLTATTWLSTPTSIPIKYLFSISQFITILNEFLVPFFGVFYSKLP